MPQTKLLHFHKRTDGKWGFTYLSLCAWHATPKNSATQLLQRLGEDSSEFLENLGYFIDKAISRVVSTLVPFCLFPVSPFCLIPCVHLHEQVKSDPGWFAGKSTISCRRVRGMRCTIPSMSSWSRRKRGYPARRLEKAKKRTTR